MKNHNKHTNNLETLGAFKFLRPQNIFADAISLVIAGVFIAFQVHGQDGYLQIVGPPALRFEVNNTNELLLAARFPMPHPKPTPAVVANAVAKPTDSVVTTNFNLSVAPNSTNAMPFVLATTNQAAIFSVSGGTGDSVVGASAPAEELLPTTPQMIMQYLKPDPKDGNLNLTNRSATAIFVPTWMGFMPTLMQFPAENKTESRATYISQ